MGTGSFDRDGVLDRLALFPKVWTTSRRLNKLPKVLDNIPKAKQTHHRSPAPSAHRSRNHHDHQPTNNDHYRQHSSTDDGTDRPEVTKG